MSVTIKTVEMQYKGTDGQYHGINAVAEKRISDQIADIDVALAAKEGEINEFIEDAEDQIDAAMESGQNALNGIDEQVNNMIESIAAVAGQGTDTTMTLSRVAADAQAAGKIVKVSTEEPTESSNRLWIGDGEEEEYTVPTYEEFSDLKSALKDTDENILDYLYTTALGNPRTDIEYVADTLPASTQGTVKGTVGESLVFGSSANYVYYKIDCKIIKDWKVKTYQKTSSTYPYYIYAVDASGIVLETYAPVPGTAGLNEFTVNLPFNCVYMYVLCGVQTGYDASIAKGTYEKFIDQAMNINKYVMSVSDKGDNYITNDIIGNIFQLLKLERIEATTENGGIQGDIGEQIKLTNTTTYKRCEIDCSLYKMYSVRLSQSTSLNYPYYAIAIDSYGKIVYKGMEKGTSVRTATGDIKLPYEAKKLYLMATSSSMVFEVNKIIFRDISERLVALDNNPADFETIIKNKAVTVQSHNRMNRFMNIAIITDTHIIPESDGYHCMRNIELFKDITGLCDLAVHLGDITQATDNTLEETAYNRVVARRKFDGIMCPIYFVRGNHDINARYNSETSWSELIDKTDIDLNQVSSNSDFNTVYQSRATTGDIVVNSADPYGNYFYCDYDNFKVRCIVLSDWAESTYDEVQVIGETQAKWFAEIALDLTGKSDPQNWLVLVFKHSSTVSTGGTDLENDRLKDIIAGFMEGRRNTLSYNVKFATQGAIPLVVIHGNNHVDQYENNNKFSVIGIDQSFSANAKTERFGTNNEFCCDVWTVDTVNKILYETRFGRGSDRAYKYGTLGTANNYQIVE